MWKRFLPEDYHDLGTVMAGTLSRNLLRGVFKILIAGFLTPAALGTLRAVFSFFKLVTSLAELGLDYASVTLVSAALGKRDQRDAKEILGAILSLKILISATLLVAGNLLAPAIARSILGDAGLTIYVRMVFLASGGQLLWRYISSYLSAHQRFRPLALFLTTVPALMLLSAAILIALDRFTLAEGIVIYLFAPLAATILWWPAIERGLLTRPFLNGPLVRRITRFSRWVYLSSVASANRNHINPLLLKNPTLSGSVAAGAESAGLYSFGNDMANEVTVFSQSLVTVLLPKASRMTSGPELRGFVKRSYKHIALLLVPLASFVFVAEPFLRGLGYIKPSYLEYLPSLRVFVILYLGTMFTIASIPIQAALYAMKLPQFEAWVETVMIFVLVGGSILLIPRFGYEGAAVMVFVQRMVSFVALLAYGLTQLAKMPGETDKGA